MLSTDIDAFRRRWSARIAADALARRVIATLWRERARYVNPVLDEARSDNPIIDPVIASEPVEMARHVDDHFRALLSLPGRRRGAASADPLGFVVAHGIRRAQGGVPLRAVLQAYRSGHKSFWAIMCREIDRLADSPAAGMRATMLLSDYCIEYTDLISVVVTDAYVGEESRLADERTRLGLALVESLLRGTLPTLEPALRRCTAAGIVDGASLVVLVARGGAPAASRARGDLALALERSLQAAACPGIVEARSEDVVAIVQAHDATGARVARALRHDAAGLLRAPLQSQRIGIGLAVRSIAELPRSFDEACRAIELQGDGQAVAHLAELDVNAYLRSAADATAHRLAPALPGEVRAEPLASTLQAFAAADLNVKACARALGVHTNTIYHRLNRVHTLTGLDPRGFAALSRLLTALALARTGITAA